MKLIIQQNLYLGVSHTLSGTFTEIKKSNKKKYSERCDLVKTTEGSAHMYTFSNSVHDP